MLLSVLLLDQRDDVDLLGIVNRSFKYRFRLECLCWIIYLKKFEGLDRSWDPEVLDS